MRHWSLAARFTAVVLVALVASSLVNFAVTFSGPPPMRRPVVLSDLLPTLARQAPVPRDMPWVSVRAGAAGFVPNPGERPAPGTAAALARQLGVPVSAIQVTLKPGHLIGEFQQPVSEARDSFTLGLHQPDGSWRIIRGQPAPIVTRWHWVTLSLTLLSALVFALLSMFVARGVVRPLDRLGREANRVEVDRDHPITAGGPPEVARVARAVAAMRDRLATALEDRTLMFTALAHDMAAPVARLRFRLAHLPEAQREAAEHDLAELSEMIAGIVEFAAVGRGQRALCPIDAVELAHEVAESECVSFASDSDSAIVSGDAFALRRLLGNLIINARRYAGDCEVSATVLGETLQLMVSDRGPGIPGHLGSRLFEPFFRVEPSRSRETAGAGLGLAIARAIAEEHGGSLTYSPRPGGGSQFTLSLPIHTVWGQDALIAPSKFEAK